MEESLDHVAKVLAENTLQHFLAHQHNPKNPYQYHKDLNEIASMRLGIYDRYRYWMKEWAKTYQVEYIDN